MTVPSCETTGMWNVSEALKSIWAVIAQQLSAFLFLYVLLPWNEFAEEWKALKV